MTGQRVTVTIEERDFDGTVAALRAAGMAGMQVHREIGVVSGDIANSAALVDIPGVMVVEPEGRTHIAPPNAGIQ
ncbi:MAG: hypothetical protein ACRDTI_04375 [Mycobacterium sp.]